MSIAAAVILVVCVIALSIAAVVSIESALVRMSTSRPYHSIAWSKHRDCVFSMLLTGVAFGVLIALTFDGGGVTPKPVRWPSAFSSTGRPVDLPGPYSAVLGGKTPHP